MTTPPVSPTALEGVRVLDFSRVLAGPWCAQNLADLGADVIKVERAGVGDDTRGWGPPFLRDGEGHDSRDSTYYASTNRGKRSITLDISKPEGREIAIELARHSQIFLENYKVGDLARYGLDYESLRKVNPALVYCSITGYGQDGPDAHKPGYDFVFQGMGGLMSITGERDDKPGGGPQKVGVALVDILTGMYATVAVLGALRHAERTGEGQYIDLALLDTIVAFGSNQIISYLTSGRVPKRYGNAHANVVPYNVFETADGHMILAVGNDSQWLGTCRAIGRPDLEADARFRKMSGRITNRDELLADLEAHLRTQPSDHWIAALEREGVPCGRINDYAQVLEEPQVKHRGLKIELPRADGGKSPGIRSPLRMSGTPVRHENAPPLLGQHTDAVLGEMLGMDAARIAELRAKSVL
ncbi:CoA transferase [Burkholderiaceae bacterium FT117]|uniref:CaiB/BaiF CoA transferase family protein n=1 Tax=Zeimonas sediminis TaxID=2944268 RepID=UPI002342F5FC|nr:CaiB/BaiF CoA-transferase family protein [Zeimonas sediminis]MCM5571216.1 CoA transferase [Zeimonas sediminis]